MAIRQDVKWLQKITKFPILVKGVHTAKDSKKVALPIFNRRHSNSMYGCLNINIFFYIGFDYAARLAIQLDN